MNKSKHHNRLLVELIRSEKWYYLASVVSVGFASYFMFLVPTIGKVVIDRVIDHPRLTTPGLIENLVQSVGGVDVLARNLWIVGLAIVAATVLAGLFMYLKDYLAAKACEGTVRDLRNRLYAHLHRLPEKYLGNADSGDILQRCTSDIDTLREFLTVQVMNIGRTVVLLCIMIPLMLAQSIAMSALSLVLLPIVFYFAWHFFGRIKVLFQEVEEAEGELTNIVQENLTGIRVVRAFARQAHECAKFEEKNYHYSELNYRLICMLANFWSLSDLLCLAQGGVLLIGGGWLVANDQASMGTYFAFIGYTTILIWPIRQLGQELSEASKATVSMGRIQEILSVPEETDQDGPAQSGVALSGRITFNDLSFGYDANKPVLRNLNFEIAAGETVAIVGPTGAGKSTIIRLLMRLYDYDQGSIQLDGQELCSIDRTTVRQHIGTLLQEPFLFSRSLRENIKFGRRQASDEDMFLSSNDASVHHTIQGFSRGYETVIGERGVSLSGGQKQRVTLSRTLLQDTPILILDDTLSAVDSATERNIIQALHKKRGEQTLLIITHRISVCREADRILVMQNGRLSAQGSHEQLIDQPGFYRDLWGIQSGQNSEFQNSLSKPVEKEHRSG